MTDRIDLDDLETGTDEEDETENRGDWLWRDDGPTEPVDEPDSPSLTSADSATSSPDGQSHDHDSPGDESTANDADGDATDPDRTPVPHVPQTGERTPVGIPSQGRGGNGGSGADNAGSSSGAANSSNAVSAPESESLRPMGSEAAGAAADDTPASGPHGSGPDEMTMAITYTAIQRLEHPAAVFASAYEWSDWVGIVGDVPAHVVQKFQRDHGIDVDFFNGTGTGPGERLAEIDRNSMFYAERMVVVGLAGEDEPIAEAADWEFVPLETAAEKADWKLAEDSS